MIISTTPTLEGRPIAEYRGLVSGEAILGANIFKDLFAGIRDITGGRSGAYEQELNKARTFAVEEMTAAAAALGADAVVGVDLDYETVGQGGSMLMVTASGTAVLSANGPAKRARARQARPGHDWNQERSDRHRKSPSSAIRNAPRPHPTKDRAPEGPSAATRNAGGSKGAAPARRCRRDRGRPQSRKARDDLVRSSFEGLGSRPGRGGRGAVPGAIGAGGSAGGRARAAATAVAKALAVSAGRLPSHAASISLTRTVSAARRSRSARECFVIVVLRLSGRLGRTVNGPFGANLEGEVYARSAARRLRRAEREHQGQLPAARRQHEEAAPGLRLDQEVRAPWRYGCSSATRSAGRRR